MHRRRSRTRTGRQRRPGSRRPSNLPTGGPRRPPARPRLARATSREPLDPRPGKGYLLQEIVTGHLPRARERGEQGNSARVAAPHPLAQGVPRSSSRTRGPPEVPGRGPDAIHLTSGPGTLAAASKVANRIRLPGASRGAERGADERVSPGSQARGSVRAVFAPSSRGGTAPRRTGGARVGPDSDRRVPGRSLRRGNMGLLAGPAGPPVLRLRGLPAGSIDSRLRNGADPLAVPVRASPNAPSSARCGNRGSAGAPRPLVSGGGDRLGRGGDPRLGGLTSRVRRSQLGAVRGALGLAPRRGSHRCGSGRFRAVCRPSLGGETGPSEVVDTAGPRSTASADLSSASTPPFRERRASRWSVRTSGQPRLRSGSRPGFGPAGVDCVPRA